MDDSVSRPRCQAVRHDSFEEVSNCSACSNLVLSKCLARLLCAYCGDIFRRTKWNSRVLGPIVIRITATRHLEALAILIRYDFIENMDWVKQLNESSGRTTVRHLIITIKCNLYNTI